MPAFTARIERPPFYRGGSASKKDGWLLPHPASDRARSASKKDGLAAPFIIFQGLLVARA